MLAYKVETSPDTPALKTGQETYTWKEIEKASQIIADDLASLGVGRYKDLIIRGGENIMPAEIESAISELDIIENVRVIGVPSDFYGEEVAACADCLKKDRKAGRASEHKELEFLICFLEHRLG